jgi:hypothetical protein
LDVPIAQCYVFWFLVSEEKLETCYLRIRRLSPISGLVIKNN